MIFLTFFRVIARHVPADPETGPEKCGAARRAD
jgi:hypothetical protein